VHILVPFIFCLQENDHMATLVQGSLGNVVGG
jgi:hypothetical protein